MAHFCKCCLETHLPKILVADDNSNIQKMVTLAFKGEGIDVVAVGNGEAAVKKTIEIVPDLVLADIFMPVRSGYEVCEFLKQDPRFSHIPVVLLAGAFDPFDEREAQRVGADGVLKKPFVPPDPLVTLVKGLLAKSAEKLVAVAVPVQSVSAQSSATTPEASASSAPAFVPSTFVPPPFVPTPVPSSLDASVKEDEYPEDDVELGTTAPPMRDFSIPAAVPDSVHQGGADAFGSMLDTSPLGTMNPMLHKLGKPEAEEAIGEDRDIEPASAHTAFEGFSPWRASASSAGVVEEEETSTQPAPERAAEQENQFMPSSKELMGRVWEIDPTLVDKSPEETVIDPRDEISPLTQSIQHVTSVRQEAAAAVETPAVEESGGPAAEENDTNSKAADWRSAFAQIPEAAAQIVEKPALSMAPWKMSTPPAENFQSDRLSEAASFAEVSSVGEVEGVAEVESVTDDSSAPEVEATAGVTTEFAADEQQETSGQIETASGATTEAEDSTSAEESSSPASDVVEPAIAHAESFDAPPTEVAEPAAAHLEDQPESFSAQEHEYSEDEHHSTVERNASAVEESPSHSASENVETSDWIAELPAHLSPEDTTTIARSVVEQLAPSAVESIATSFPVPMGTQTDPRVVEDIVARVVERMQPQILEIITREVLRPVVEALVRRQLEQKLPE
jgi:CheY-like chemotaxis protein